MEYRNTLCMTKERVVYDGRRDMVAACVRTGKSSQYAVG